MGGRGGLARARPFPKLSSPPYVGIGTRVEGRRSTTVDDLPHHDDVPPRPEPWPRLPLLMVFNSSANPDRFIRSLPRAVWRRFARN